MKNPTSKARLTGPSSRASSRRKGARGPEEVVGSTEMTTGGVVVETETIEMTMRPTSTDRRGEVAGETRTGMSRGEGELRGAIAGPETEDAIENPGEGADLMTMKKDTSVTHPR